MPYQAAKRANDTDLPPKSCDQQSETDEQAAENTAQGADLLLSLTKAACSNLVVTPKGSDGNATITETFKKGMRSCDSGMGPPIATTGILQQNNHHPRMLYHSPIKISSSSTVSTSREESRKASVPEVMSSELAPYTMLPAWSPSLYNGMVHPSYGRTPPFHPQHMNAFVVDNKNGKRVISDVEEKKDLEDVSNLTRKQRLISPSSSNEKPEEESPPDSHTADKNCMWPRHCPHPPTMYHGPPHWQHIPGYSPPPHMPYPPPPPHYAMYSPYPPPWGPYGPPPTHSPNIFPPTTFPRHQSPPPPQVTVSKDRTKSTIEKVNHVSKESLRDDKEQISNASTNESLKRCIPLKQPIPKRSWS
jgi:hypothetical protein